MEPRPPRKKRKSIDAPGHCHGLTFSCYRRQRLFESDEMKRRFLKHVEKAREKHGFQVFAYVVMPEHIHMLVFPNEAKMSPILRSLKQGFSQSIKAHLKRANDPLLSKMMTGNPKQPYAFWQAGGGFDRNFKRAEAAWRQIRYIHLNPVRRGLVEKPEDWAFSSARSYLDLSPVEFEVDRCTWTDS